MATHISYPDIICPVCGYKIKYMPWLQNITRIYCSVSPNSGCGTLYNPKTGRIYLYMGKEQLSIAEI